MRVCISAIAALLCLVSAALAGEPKPVRFNDNCGERPDCLEMALYLNGPPGIESSSLNKLEKHPLVRRVTGYDKQYFNGEVTFVGRWEVEMLVTGRRAGDPLRQHSFLLSVGVAEMDCSGFGRFTVPVVGQSPDGNPIILTDTGEFEMVEDLLGVGCQTCLELIDPDTKKIISEHRTPGWDMDATGFAPEDFAFDDEGGYYLRKDNRCLRLHDNQRYETVEMARCEATTVIGDFGQQVEGFHLDSAEWLLKSTHSRSLAKLHAGSCT